MSIQWKGVMPATLTQFNADLTIDHGIMAEHGKWLIENGCSAIVVHGSLGEGATLSFAEKVALQKTYVEAVPNTPIIPGVAALSTKEAVDLAKAAKKEDGYGYEFADDPLAAGGFGPNDATIRVRPGPVRTTLIRPRTSFVPEMLKSVENL